MVGSIPSINVFKRESVPIIILLNLLTFPKKPG